MKKGDDGDRGSLGEHLDSVRTISGDGKVRTRRPPLLGACPVSEEMSWGRGVGVGEDKEMRLLAAFNEVPLK